ncbi:hypothetical protein [Faecalibacterium sp. An192]|uniref:O-antigen ligase family protein n=1 Tax=Faecalibacterium sp. An192 TaxID=1965581 RepID=UPI001182892C|nr:hypothetical protein [Faecalibacterium sp. An192]
MVHDVILLIICYLLVFQYQLIQVIPFFGYIDELVTIFFGAYFIGCCLKSREINKYHATIVCCMIGIIVIGIIGGIRSQLQENPKIILADIFYCFKVFIAFLGADKFAKSCNMRRVIKYLAPPICLLVVVSAVCAIINQFVDIGMSSGITLQFPIKNYAFIFSSNGVPIPGVYSMYAYMYLIILTVKAKYEYENFRLRKRNNFYLGCTLFSLICTLQSRAFAFSLIYVVLYYLIIIKQIKRRRVFEKLTEIIKLRYLLVLGFAVAFLGRYKFVYFFIDGVNTARYAFWKYGLKTMAQYFPIGSGFATFGTYQAFINYSFLYTLYGMNEVYGLAEDDGSMAADGYWPAIIAQFGVLGTILMVILLFDLFKYIIRKCGKNPYSMLAGIMVCIISLISSIATSAFFHFTTIGLYCILILNFDEEYNHFWNFEKEENNGTSNSLYPYI